MTLPSDRPETDSMRTFLVLALALFACLGCHAHRMYRRSIGPDGEHERQMFLAVIRGLEALPRNRPAFVSEQDWNALSRRAGELRNRATNILVRAEGLSNPRTVGNVDRFSDVYANKAQTDQELRRGLERHLANQEKTNKETSNQQQQQKEQTLPAEEKNGLHQVPANESLAVPVC